MEEANVSTFLWMLGECFLFAVIIAIPFTVLFYFMLKREERLGKEMKVTLLPGQKYKDLKNGGTLTIIATGKSLGDHGAPTVCYKNEDETVLMRPYESFLRKIRHEGRKTRRFELVA
jgi:hypothetical protein